MIEEKIHSPLAAQLPSIDEYSQLDNNLDQQQQNQNVYQGETFLKLTYKPYFDQHLFIENDNKEQFSYYIKNEKVINYPIICIHGAGFSALSFCELAYLLKDDSSIISIDLRGHGYSSNVYSYQFDQYVNDLQQIIVKILDKHAVKKLEKYSIVLIGHSFGGSLITGISHPRLDIQCLCPIDIAEHIAMRSLRNMGMVVQILNKKYQSYQQAVDNYIKNKILVNERAVKLQIVSLLDEKTMMPKFNFYDSEIYWQGWFENFDKKFLNNQSYKFLVVSNYQNLDPEQEIAYSQGIMALEIINGNHNIHEEQPVQYAYVLQRFLRRLHLTQQTYSQAMDYTQPLQTWELPDDKQQMKVKLDKAWNECIELSQQANKQ